ncbi:MAG: hypothetical protein ACR2P3_12295, partial [Geminicoccaceae bacterium]
SWTCIKRRVGDNCQFENTQYVIEITGLAHGLVSGFLKLSGRKTPVVVTRNQLGKTISTACSLQRGCESKDRNEEPLTSDGRSYA